MPCGPGCATCGEFMRPRKNETIVLETMDDDRKPYRIWAADLWECPTCGHQITTGYGNSPIAEHFQTDHFGIWVDRADVTLDGKLKALPPPSSQSTAAIMARFDKLVADLDRIVKGVRRGT